MARLSPGPPLCALGVVALDQITKNWVLSATAFNATECLNAISKCGQIKLTPLFDLSMVWNRGVSFGLLQSGGSIVLILGTGIIAVGFAWWMTKSKPFPTGYSLALIVGGAIGNLIDRVRFSAVIDFLDFSGMFFPFVFNVADACITSGAIALILCQTLARPDRQE